MYKKERRQDRDWNWGKLFSYTLCFFWIHKVITQSLYYCITIDTIATSWNGSVRYSIYGITNYYDDGALYNCIIITENLKSSYHNVMTLRCSENLHNVHFRYIQSPKWTLCFFNMHGSYWNFKNNYDNNRGLYYDLEHSCTPMIVG